MTKQEEIALIGVATAAVTKFYFQKSWMLSLVFGLAAISTYSILTAQNSTS